MDKTSEYYIDLIFRYFSGEATPEEISVLSEWVRRSEENHKVFDVYRRTWVLMEQSNLYSQIDLDDEWASFSKRINQEEKPHEGRIIELKNISKKHTGTGRRWWNIAAALLVIVSISAFLFYYFLKPGQVVLTAEAGTTEFSLPDGSKVTLNKGAVIEYPSRFSPKLRQVKLRGEAFFNVTHDPSKPFIVSGENVNVEVLGTQFNVNTKNREGNVSVVLATGKIALSFSDRTSDKVVLLPGEKADISVEKHLILKTLNNDPNYLAWKTGHIQFDNVSLSEIIKTISSVYHTEIVLADPGIGRCRLTVTFDHQPVSSVINVLRNTLDLQVRKEGNVISLSGKPCD